MNDNKHDNLKGLFEAAILALQQYSSRSSFANSNIETIAEIETRLQRLNLQYSELMSLNTELLNIDPLRVDYRVDVDTDIHSISVGGEVVIRMKLNRADPNVPIVSRNSFTSAYHTGEKNNEEPEQMKNLKVQLESKLEDYYQSAHRILKLIMKLEDAKKIDAKGVTRVRNKLIEHPPKGALYTFGWTNSGPRIKPMHRGDLNWNDDGLEPNTIEFLEELIRCLKSPSSNL